MAHKTPVKEKNNSIVVNVAKEMLSGILESRIEFIMKQQYVSVLFCFTKRDCFLFKTKILFMSNVLKGNSIEKKILTKWKEINVFSGLSMGGSNRESLSYT